MPCKTSRGLCFGALQILCCIGALLGSLVKFQGATQSSLLRHFVKTLAWVPYKAPRGFTKPLAWVLHKTNLPMGFIYSLPCGHFFCHELYLLSISAKKIIFPASHHHRVGQKWGRKFHKQFFSGIQYSEFRNVMYGTSSPCGLRNRGH